MGIFDLASDWNSFEPKAEPQDGFTPHVMGFINNVSPGGIVGLVQKFHDVGLSDVVSSWVGTGQNEPISAEEVDAVVGGEQVQRLADGAHISREEAAEKLAQMLPQIIDKLTPKGQLLTASIMEALQARASRKLI